MELDIHLKQTTSLSPQMLQSMKILQMGSQELLEYVETLIQENPALELEEPHKKQDEFNQLQKKLEWLESTDIQNRYYRCSPEEEDESGNSLEHCGLQTEEDDNLYFYVLSQLRLMELPLRLRRAAAFIVESLDGNGYLDEDTEKLTRRLKLSAGETERALKLVQSLDPAGVGARNLQECLLLQLDRREGNWGLARRIISEYLPLVGKNKYTQIAKELGSSPEAVQTACELIRSLNPRPGSGFAARENLIYINPDLFVVNFSDHFELLLNDYFFPTLHISGYYRALMKETAEPEVRKYLTDKVKQAKWVVRSIEQRRGTLLRCAACILERQESFFRQGPGHLVPMSLADVASMLKIHESTVCRAVRDKYIQCSSGVYPMEYFFSRALGSTQPGSGCHCPDSAKAMIKRCIGGEDRKKPLSDQKISELLRRQEGLDISRRTVAKYRDELKIPNASERKTRL